MHAAGAIYVPVRRDPAVRKRLRELSLALTLSVALHLGALLTLLFTWPDRLRPAAVPPAPMVATLITRPSSAPVDAPTPTAEPVAKPVTPPKPKPGPRPNPRPNPRQAQAPTRAPPPEASSPSAAAQAVPSTTAVSVGDAVSAAPAGPVMVEFPYAYLARMSRTITLRLNYPAYSRQFGEEGRAIVRVTLRRDGTILDAVVVRRTGYSYLDAEARNVILRIARFPPVPEHIHPAQAEFVIDQPISFKRS